MKKKLFLVIALALVMVLALSAVALAAGEPIDTVDIKTVSSVTAGERLGNTYISYDKPCNYTFVEYQWASGSHNSFDKVINSETRAEAGEEYVYRLYLKPDYGYSFPSTYVANNASNIYSGTLIVNGKPVQGWVDKGTGYLHYDAEWMTAEGPSEITNVKFSGMDNPVAGQTCDRTVKVPSSAPYTVKEVAWQNNSSDWTTSEFTFEAGKYYQCCVTLQAKDGYTFPNMGSIFGLRPYDGTITNTDTKETFSGAVSADGKSMWFWPIAVDNLPEGLAIVEQPKDQSAIPGGDAVFTVEASGENLKYQWYGGTDASPTPLGGNANTLTLTNLTLNNSGTEFWCVVSNDAGSVTSNKATLTVSDSYVFPFTDVTTKDWFYSDVKTANQMKLIDGKTATLFKPKDNMTYAEAIKLAACMNQYYTAGAITLKPATSGNWYQTYVDYAKTHGIPWSFDNYNANITRADYAYIFYYALPASDYKQLNSLGLANIPDVGPSTFASSEILTLYNAGILRGSDDINTGVKGYFKPDDCIIRAEVAAILTRMMNKDTRIKFSL